MDNSKLNNFILELREEINHIDNTQKENYLFYKINNFLEIEQHNITYENILTNITSNNIHKHVAFSFCL